MNWFQGFNSPEAIKKHWRKLAMLHHPDRGGSNETMAEINDQYHAALGRCEGQASKDDQGFKHTYHYDRDVEQSIMDQINRLIQLRMSDVEIWLVGRWVWIRGDTRQYRAKLKAEGCVWHSKRKCWYWKPYAGRTYYNRKSDFAGLAQKYGFRQFNNDDDEKD